ncbi:MAG: hypothetical protein JSR21_19590 [Proteobacteria bacterium]|nr:hypothetical protein [Pseudomonadota bacterium]
MRAASVAAALLAAGCTYKTDLQGPGTLRVNMPGRLPAPAVAAPAAPVPTPDGRFSGTGTLTASAGSGCQRTRPFNNVVVSGNRVRYQGFRGTIDANGFARLQSGERFLYGFFNGPRFEGHYWQPHPDCTYDVVLTHQG